MVLLWGGQPWDRQRACGQRHSGGCGSALGGVVAGEPSMQQTRHGGGGREEKVVRRTLWAAAFRDNVAVMGGVVGGEAVVRRTMGGNAVMFLYFNCTWAWVRSIGGRRLLI